MAKNRDRSGTNHEKTTAKPNPYAELERIFHEPGRLAIMSALGGAPAGLVFTNLKEECRLTDGNLNRHLKVLQDAGAVRVEKEFVGLKPRTTVFLSDQGRESFRRYLEALEAVLRQAEKKLAGTISTDSVAQNPMEKMILERWRKSRERADKLLGGLT